MTTLSTENSSIPSSIFCKTLKYKMPIFKENLLFIFLNSVIDLFFTKKIKPPIQENTKIIIKIIKNNAITISKEILPIPFLFQSKNIFHVKNRKAKEQIRDKKSELIAIFNTNCLSALIFSFTNITYFIIRIY